MKTIPLWVFEFVSFIHNPCCPFAPRRSIGRSIAVCLCIYECVYVCYAYVYMYVYAYVYMYVCMYVCIYVTILVYAYVCVYICMHMCSKTSQQQGLVSHLANSFASEVIDTTMLQCFTCVSPTTTNQTNMQSNKQFTKQFLADEQVVPNTYLQSHHFSSQIYWSDNMETGVHRREGSFANWLASTLYQHQHRPCIRARADR